MLNRISKSELAAIADRVGWFRLTDAELDQYASLSSSVLAVLDGVDAAGLDQAWALDGATQAPTVRVPGRRPLPGEDPFNAVVRWCRVKQDGNDGPLAGMRLAVKDSVAIAGVPMTAGSTVLRGFTPSIDSVVVERLLRDGAEIVAVTNMDDFAFSGGGDTSSYGDIGNPFALERSAGGSSGGSAAALYYGDVVDGAIGCDQGGSIRVPAAWCGVLGLKPTHSLVPYTGIAGIDATFDHVGPMARSAGTLGRLLASMAGPHPSDPRQAGVVWDGEALQRALASEETGFDGLRVGLLIEGFSEDDDLRKANSAVVRDCAAKLAAAGAVVEEVSVPAHLTGGGIAFAGFIEGMAALLQGGGNGYHAGGRYSPELALALNQGLRTRGQELPAQIKLVMLLGEHLRQNYSGAVYAAAQNQRPWLREAYDVALRQYDVLLLPTTPYPAFRHEPGLDIAEKALRGWEPLGNCAAFDMTGHPAITLPVGTVDGLPVGAMLVGRRFDDARLVDLAGRYERRFGWDASISARQAEQTGPVAPPV
jgi:amidase